MRKVCCLRKKMGVAQFCSLSEIARALRTADRVFTFVCVFPLLSVPLAKHGEVESGCLCHQLPRGPLDVRGVSLRPGSLPQPPSPRRDKGHLRLPVLPQRAGGEAEAAAERARERSASFHRRATRWGIYVRLYEHG